MSRQTENLWWKRVGRLLTPFAGMALGASGLLMAISVTVPVSAQDPTGPKRLPSEIIALDVTPLERLPNIPFPMPPELEGVDLNKQSEESVALKSDSCLSCHIDAKDPHCKPSLRLDRGCWCSRRAGQGQCSPPNTRPFSRRNHRP